MEGNPDPSVAETARKVECATRSIYERFEAIDELHGAASEPAIAQAGALAPLIRADADRPTRIGDQVKARAGTCFAYGAFWGASQNTSLRLAISGSTPSIASCHPRRSFRSQ